MKVGGGASERPSGGGGAHPEQPRCSPRNPPPLALSPVLQRQGVSSGSESRPGALAGMAGGLISDRDGVSRCRQGALGLQRLSTCRSPLPPLPALTSAGRCGSNAHIHWAEAGMPPVCDCASIATGLLHAAQPMHSAGNGCRAGRPPTCEGGGACMLRACVARRPRPPQVRAHSSHPLVTASTTARQACKCASSFRPAGGGVE